MARTSRHPGGARIGAAALALVLVSAACGTGAVQPAAVVVSQAPSVSAAPATPSPKATLSPSAKATSGGTAPFEVPSCPDPAPAPTNIEAGPDATIPKPAVLKRLEAFSTDFPQGLAVVAGSVWTANESLDTVTRVDATTGDVTAINVAPGLGPQRIVDAAGAVWSAGAGGLVRIDVDSNTVDQRVSGCVISLASAFGSLWAGVNGGVIRIDPETGLVVKEVHPDAAAGLLCQVSEADDSMWLGCGPRLSRIDPSSNAVLATLTSNGTYATVMAADGAAWVVTGLDPFAVESPEDAYTTLERLDLETNRIVPDTRLRLVHGASAGGRLADGNVVWMSTSFGVEPGAGKLYAFEPASGKVVMAYDISEGRGYGSNALAFGYGSLWTASGTANAVRRFPRPNP